LLAIPISQGGWDKTSLDKEQDLVSDEAIFVDGTKINADANKYSSSIFKSSATMITNS
jgi:hypothetical protein